MRNKYVSTCLLVSTLSILFFFCSKHFSRIETNVWKESSIAKIKFLSSSLRHPEEDNVDWKQRQMKVEKYCEALLSNSSQHHQTPVAIC